MQRRFRLECAAADGGGARGAPSRIGQSEIRIRAGLIAAGQNSGGSGGQQRPASDVELRKGDLPIRTLVVEDDALLAFDLQMTLEEFGAEVVGIAETAADAVDLAARTHPDVVLMDIRLRGEGDGIDAARRIQAAGPGGPAIVFATGNADPQTLRRVKDVAASAVLLKPIRPANLLRAVFDACRD